MIREVMNVHNTLKYSLKTIKVDVMSKTKNFQAPQYRKYLYITITSWCTCRPHTHTHSHTHVNNGITTMCTPITTIC